VLVAPEDSVVVVRTSPDGRVAVSNTVARVSGEVRTTLKPVAVRVRSNVCVLPRLSRSVFRRPAASYVKAAALPSGSVSDARSPPSW
jgi:hypothetical protein